MCMDMPLHVMSWRCYHVTHALALYTSPLVSNTSTSDNIRHLLLTLASTLELLPHALDTAPSSVMNQLFLVRVLVAYMMGNVAYAQVSDIHTHMHIMDAAYMSCLKYQHMRAVCATSCVELDT